MSDSTNDQTIHFTIGPVQGFLAQARRTRDLWSGSFLLSYLSGCAMAEIRNPDGKWNGKIRIPDVTEDPLLRWIEMRQKDGESPPRIGTLPNRFQATAADPAEAAKAAVEGVKSSWLKIADKVWETYIDSEALDLGADTKRTWKRQVNNFWEIYWTVGDLPGMEARKNWRFCSDWQKGRPTIEGGDHCTIMGDWQELSGYMRAKDSKKQDEFWNRLRQNTRGMDLRSGERLCSIALIKRMFPKISKETIGWYVEADRWPSTLYMAAIPWLKTLLERAELADEAEKYASKAIDASEEIERKGISEQIFGEIGKGHRFLEIDGNFYFKAALKNSRRTPLKETLEDGKESEKVRKIRQDLLESINALYDKSGNMPFPFYGMLLMDGDSMGKLIRSQGETVSKALACFTKEVDGIVRDHDGILIYAGGDDVLAMLPRLKSLRCAHALSEKFERAFQSNRIPEATISAGLVFASYKVPLRSVMREAHSILDDIAKEENGRGSIAVSVLKGSGKYCQWVSSWKGLTNDKGILLDEIADSLNKENSLSKSFFYRMREILVMLSGESCWRPGMFFEQKGGLQDLDIQDLLFAEYVNALEHTTEIDASKLEEAKMSVEKLLLASQRHKRIEKSKEPAPLTPAFGADGPLLIKFLAQKEVSE